MTLEDHYLAILGMDAEVRAIPPKVLYVDLKFQEAINKHQREIDKLRKEAKK